MTSEEDAANGLADVYEATLNVSPPQTDPPTGVQVHSSNQYVANKFNKTITTFSTSNKSSDQHSSFFTKVDEVTEITHSLKGKKSSGLDNVTNCDLKQLPKKVLLFLVILFNNCLNWGYFPSAWKMAKIVPIHKAGKDKCLDNFRPVSLLSNVGKIFEKVILSRLSRHIHDKKLIPNNQHGFRSMHSTVSALAKFHRDVTYSLNSDMYVACCAIDFTKAFDRIWHGGLIHKLRKKKVPVNLLRILASFLQERQAYVQFNTSKSRNFQISSGVPQGSILGPTLYNIFVSDIPSSNAPLRATQTLLYADDTLVYSISDSPRIAVERLNAQLDKIQPYTETWGLKINVEKSVAIILRHNHTATRRIRNIQIKLNNTPLKIVHQLKYLGVSFDKYFNFLPHVKETLNKANLAFRYIKFLFHNKFLNGKVKSNIYKQLLRPIITYAFPIWHSISPSQYNKLIKYERKVLRHATGLMFNRTTKRHYSTKLLLSKSKTIPITQHLAKLAIKLMTNLKDHTNPHLASIFRDSREIEAANPRSHLKNFINDSFVQNHLNPEIGSQYFFNNTSSSHRRG